MLGNGGHRLCCRFRMYKVWKSVNIHESTSRAPLWGRLRLFLSQRCLWDTTFAQRRVHRIKRLTQCQHEHKSKVFTLVPVYYLRMKKLSTCLHVWLTVTPGGNC